MPIRTKQECIQRALTLRNYFRQYAPNSSYARQSDAQIRKNVNNRYSFYCKANELKDLEKRNLELMQSDEMLGKVGKNYFLKRFPPLAFPVDDLEKQNKLLSAWKGDDISKKTKFTKELFDEILNTDFSDAFDSMTDAKKCLEKAEKYKEKANLAYITLGIIQELEANRDKVPFPQNYFETANKMKSYLEALEYLHNQTLLMASDFNFLETDKNASLAFSQNKQEIIEEVFIQAGITDPEQLEAQGKIVFSPVTLYNELFDFNENFKNSGIKGRLCDYKLEDPNDNSDYYSAILANKKFVKKSPQELENDVELNADAYKKLWYTTRCNKFNNFTNEISRTLIFDDKTIEKNLNHFAMLSKINNDHKKDLSGWDYINPVGWHKRTRYRKEKDCINNMRNALLEKGYPKELLDRINQDGDTLCVTKLMRDHLPAIMEERRNNPQARNNAFNVDQYSVYMLSGKDATQRSKKKPLSTLQAAERNQMRQGASNKDRQNENNRQINNEMSNNNN